MTREEKLRLADKLAKAMLAETVKVGDPRQKITQVRGVDENELEKLLAYGKRQGDFPKIVDLLKMLIRSPWARRTRQTEGYYRNTLEVLTKHLPSSIASEDAIEILAWVTKLMRYHRRTTKLYGVLGPGSQDEFDGLKHRS